MKTLTEIKKELKSIQLSFNPEKSTYKILDKLINNNYSANEMLYELLRIKGVGKYPPALKEQFKQIVLNLKNIEQEQIKQKEEQKRKLAQKINEEKTKEIKDIIDNLEKELVKKKPKPELTKQTEKQVEKNIIIQEENKITKQNEENNLEPKQKGKLIFISLVIAVIISLIIITLIFFLY